MPSTKTLDPIEELNDLLAAHQLLGERIYRLQRALAPVSTSATAKKSRKEKYAAAAAIGIAARRKTIMDRAAKANSLKQ